jgi:hypothetical protein
MIVFHFSAPPHGLPDLRQKRIQAVIIDLIKDIFALAEAG